jgi:hypothetical protein
MILAKLQEALAEVDVQRKALDDVETQLRSMISKLSGAPAIIPPAAPLAAAILTPAAPHHRGPRDRIDDYVDIIREEGKPLHIVELAQRYSARSGNDLSRTDIEPGLNRHTKTHIRRIVKFAPSTFGLAEWKTQAKPTAQA